MSGLKQVAIGLTDVRWWRQWNWVWAGVSLVDARVSVHQLKPLHMVRLHYAHHTQRVHTTHTQTNTSLFMMVRLHYTHHTQCVHTIHTDQWSFRKTGTMARLPYTPSLPWPFLPSFPSPLLSPPLPSPSTWAPLRVWGEPQPPNVFCAYRGSRDRWTPRQRSKSNSFQGFSV